MPSAAEFGPALTRIANQLDDKTNSLPASSGETVSDPGSRTSSRTCFIDVPPGCVKVHPSILERMKRHQDNNPSPSNIQIEEISPLVAEHDWAWVMGPTSDESIQECERVLVRVVAATKQEMLAEGDAGKRL